MSGDRWAFHQGPAFTSRTAAGGERGKCSTSPTLLTRNNSRTHTSQTPDMTVMPRSVLRCSLWLVTESKKNARWLHFLIYNSLPGNWFKQSNALLNYPPGWSDFQGVVKLSKDHAPWTLYYLFSAFTRPISFIMKCLFLGCIIHDHILWACTYILYISCLSPSSWILATFFLPELGFLRLFVSLFFHPLFSSSFYFWTIKTRGTARGPFLTTSRRQ